MEPIHAKRVLRAIRRLSGAVPHATAEERIKKIGELASGKLAPDQVRRATSPDLIEKLRAGQASRSVRNARDIPEREKKKKEAEETEKKGAKREAPASNDRQEKRGTTRKGDE